MQCVALVHDRVWSRQRGFALGLWLSFAKQEKQRQQACFVCSRKQLRHVHDDVWSGRHVISNGESAYSFETIGSFPNLQKRNVYCGRLNKPCSRRSIQHSNILDEGLRQHFVCRWHSGCVRKSEHRVSHPGAEHNVWLLDSQGMPYMRIHMLQTNIFFVLE